MSNPSNTDSSLLESKCEPKVPPQSMRIGYRAWIRAGHATALLASRDVPSPSRHLSTNEVALVVDAIRGTFLFLMADLYLCVEDEISINGGDKKWGVDRAVLLDTLRCCRSVDVVALIACHVRWLDTHGSSVSELSDASGFSSLLIPTQPVPGEVFEIGEPADTLNKIDLAANASSLTGEELVAFLEHRNPRVRQHAIHRLGGDGGPDAFEEPLGKPRDTAFRE